MVSNDPLDLLAVAYEWKPVEGIDPLNRPFFKDPPPKGSYFIGTPLAPLPAVRKAVVEILRDLERFARLGKGAVWKEGPDVARIIAKRIKETADTLERGDE